jgi:flavin reductase (DIM6/NTAB) family NADH-FMN oxidoreductase RutF
MAPLLARTSSKLGTDYRTVMRLPSKCLRLPIYGSALRPLYSYSSAFVRHLFNNNNNNNNNNNFPTDWQSTTGAATNLSESLRKTMRRVPYPVMIVTSPIISNTHSTIDVAGMLVSSFATVTLTPEPIVSFNIKLPSATLIAMEKTGKFSVYAVMDEELATSFTKGQEGLKAIKSKGSLSEELERQSWFWLKCEYIKDKTMEIGDHRIVVGRVEGVERPRESASSEVQLLHVDGKFSKHP